MSIVHNMSEAEYFSNPALSSTQARQILASPAKYQWALTHPQGTRPEFEVGKAVHARVLGVGDQAIAYPDDVLASNGAASTKAAKDWAEDMRADGFIPMKAADLEPIERMAEAVLAYPEARIILERAAGREVSLFATVEGVATRARFDIHSPRNAADLKTALDASPDGFNKAVGAHGYHIQEAWYRAAHHAVTGAELDWFKFIAVEKHAPYLVGVYELDIMWRDIGKDEAAHARHLYRQCTETGIWPGYEPELLAPPSWRVYQHEEGMEIRA